MAAVDKSSIFTHKDPINKQISDKSELFFFINSNENYSLDFKYSYIELYWYLLHNINNLDRSVIKFYCNIMLAELKKLAIVNRNTLYDIVFIVSICSIFCDGIDYTIIDAKFKDVKGVKVAEQKNFTSEKRLGESNFFLEECYTDDVRLFFKEYDNLVKTKTSSFFYKSNLVNIALLLKCYHYKCLTRDDVQDKRVDIKETFKDSSINLCKLLLLSYLGFFLDHIRNFYVAYVDFYFSYIIKKDISEQPIRNKFREIIITVINDNTVYPYLSCNLSSNKKFFNFEGTRIIISHIGMNKNSDFFESLAMINHDISIHQQYNNKKNISEQQLNEIKDFLFKLYDSPKLNHKTKEKIIDLLWYCYYEASESPLVNTFVKLIGELQFTKYFKRINKFFYKDSFIRGLRKKIFYDILDYYIKQYNKQFGKNLDTYILMDKIDKKDAQDKSIIIFLNNNIVPKIDDRYREIIKNVIENKDFIIDITKDTITKSHLVLFKTNRELSSTTDYDSSLSKTRLEEIEHYSHTNYDIKFFKAFYEFMTENFPPVEQKLNENVSKILSYFEKDSGLKELELVLEAPAQLSKKEPNGLGNYDIKDKSSNDILSHNLKAGIGGTNKYKYIQLKKM